LTLAAYDESWLAEAIVSGATCVGVTLAGIRRVDLSARTEAIHEEDFLGFSYGFMAMVSHWKENLTD